MNVVERMIRKDYLRQQLVGISEWLLGQRILHVLHFFQLHVELFVRHLQARGIRSDCYNTGFEGRLNAFCSSSNTKCPIVELDIF